MRSDAERRKHGLTLLSEAQEGKKYRVASVYERDRKLLEFFEQESIRPGTNLAVQSRNYDDTITLSIGNNTVRLGLPAAARVWVGKS
jgi:hypothetical protein